MAFPMTAAQLAGNFCQALLYGVFLVTCTFCARTLLIKGSGRDERWARPHELRWMMAIMAFVFFVISTFDVAIGLLHNYEAFVRSDDAEKVFTRVSDWIDIARSTDQGILMVLADFILIYRCWIVYGRRWLIILPSVILYLGGTTSIAGLLVVMGLQSTETNITLTSDKTTPWFLAFYAITAAQNVFTTTVLVWRIWQVEKETETFYTTSSAFSQGSGQPRRLRAVIRVIAESGAAYTLCVLVTFILAAIQSNALYPASDITFQVTGIAFNIILIRSSAKRDQQFSMYDQGERSTFFNAPYHHNSTLKDAIHVSENSRPQDVELAGIGGMSDRSERSGGSESEGDLSNKIESIKIVKVVETS
ncbi:hypothetical protein NP233_g10200 [Leucocoprinus birnbaumii]|uniref:Uncharacterized protein n=1 Tax=Leucocoprinus birnbaumii TaxID=56174 RepID=A0AAD5VME6_9AGAR|nr:hypothetical protein NP233_g10200 [Leucocoprinus birnbaumii]